MSVATDKRFQNLRFLILPCVIDICLRYVCLLWRPQVYKQLGRKASKIKTLKSHENFILFCKSSLKVKKMWCFVGKRRNFIPIRTCEYFLCAAINSRVVVPLSVSPQILHNELKVPIPPYAKSGIPPNCPFLEPEIKDSVSIAKMRTSCNLARRILQSVSGIVEPGVKTDTIDKFVHDMAISNNAVRFFLT